MGANGAGKSTLLRILGGKHMHPAEKVRIGGQSAFSADDKITYLGNTWTRTVAFAGYGFVVSVTEGLGGEEEIHPHFSN